MTSGISSQFQQTDGIPGLQKPKSAQEMFSDLSIAVGGDGKEITKDQLTTALQNAQAQGDTQKAVMLSKIINNFDKLSGGTDKITADSLKSAMKSSHKGYSHSAQTATSKGNCTPCTNCGSCGKTQDPSTVTQDQLTSPIDLRV